MFKTMFIHFLPELNEEIDATLIFVHMERKPAGD